MPIFNSGVRVAFPSMQSTFVPKYADHVHDQYIKMLFVDIETWQPQQSTKPCHSKTWSFLISSFFKNKDKQFILNENYYVDFFPQITFA